MCATPYSDDRPDTCMGCAPAGTDVRVSHVDGDDALAQRLTDLGFWKGTLVRVVRRAPFGDPIEYCLRGYRLALRREEAARVRVTTETAR